MGRFMIAMLIVVGFALPFISGCSGENKQDASKKDEKVTITVTPWPGSAALYIAKEKGYFKDEGIEAILQSYRSGHLGLDAVLSKKADLAAVGDTPIARAAVHGHSMAVVITLCEIDRAVLIVARKDRGISSPGDLRGKKVGVVEGTTADFFLHILLTTSYVKPADVNIVHLATDDVVDALIRGDVDAVSTWFPNTVVATDALDDNGVVFDDPSIYKMTWNLVATKQFAESHPESIKRVLGAIVRANAFILKYPDEARAITAKMIGTESLYLDKEWEGYNFTAALNQSLIVNLEDQARWMIMKEPGRAGKTVNFMDFIYTDGLKAVLPEAVKVVRR